MLRQFNGASKYSAGKTNDIFPISRQNGNYSRAIKEFHIRFLIQFYTVVKFNDDLSTLAVNKQELVKADSNTRQETQNGLFD